MDQPEKQNPTPESTETSSQETTSSTSKKGISLLVAIPLALALLFLISVVALYFVTGKGGDIDPPSRDEVKLDIRELDSMENGYSLLMEVGEEVEKDDNFMESPQYLENFNEDRTQFKGEEVKKVLAQWKKKPWGQKYINHPTLKKALERNAAQSPEKTMWAHTKILPILSFRRLVSANVLYALDLHSQGKPNQAMKVALSIVKLSYLIEQSSPILITPMVGSALRRIGCATILYIAKSAELTSAQLVKHAQSLGKYGDFDHRWLINGFKGEAWMFINHMDALTTGDWDKFKQEMPGTLERLNMTFFFQPNRTLKAVLESNLLLIKAAKIPGKELDGFMKKNSSSAVTYYEDKGWVNSYGKKILSVATPNYAEAIKAHHETNGIQRLVQITLCLRAYKLDNGQLPAKLADLTPKYLKEIPTDPMTGKSFTYDPKKKVLFSPEKQTRGAEGKKKGWEDLHIDLDF